MIYNGDKFNSYLQKSDTYNYICDKVVLPITFDISTVGYDAATFNGASFAIVDNPSVSGTNNKASKVGAITNSGKAYEGINFDLGAPIDLITEKSIKMNFILVPFFYKK